MLHSESAPSAVICTQELASTHTYVSFFLRYRKKKIGQTVVAVVDEEEKKDGRKKKLTPLLSNTDSPDPGNKVCIFFAEDSGVIGSAMDEMKRIGAAVPLLRSTPSNH